MGWRAARGARAHAGVGEGTLGLAADALSLRAALAGVAGLALVLAAVVRFAPGRRPIG